MKKHIVKNCFCLLLAAALCLGNIASLPARTGLTAFAASQTAAAEETAAQPAVPAEQTEGVIRPEEIDEGLSVNSLDDIRGRRVTVRQPIMEILQDNIEREPADVLPNTYEMLDFKSGKKMHELAEINFAENSQLQVGNKDHPMYPMRDLARSEKNADDKVVQKYFSEFTKYMLLRQAYYFNTHVNEIIRKDELKKHPAADYIYGRIPDDAKAVKMHIITDPIYRSPMTTGLYLVPGEVATVKIKGLKAGETVSLYTHHEDTMGYLGYREDGSGFGKMEDYLDYWDTKIVNEAKQAQKENRKPNFTQFNYGLHGQWQWQNQKIPCMGTTFNIVGTGEETEVKIGSMFGGPLYIRPTTDAVDLEITGAVLTPHFVLGVTTVKEFEDQLRSAPGAIATLDVENGQLIGPADAMRKCDDIEKLAYFWHSVFAIDISLNGRDYNYNMTMCYDLHVPAGEAVALNSNFCAQPEYWFPICMNYEQLTTSGNWGTLHELGHFQAKTHGVNWGFCDGDGEVWNNTLILLIYSMLCNMDTRVIKVEHGEYVHPFTAIERSQHITQKYKDKKTGQMVQIEDYGQINEGDGAHFDQLSMYATLLHSIGPDKFVDMFYTYKMNPAYCSNKRADFVYRIGVVDRVNILNWVNTNYFAKIDENMFTDSQLEFLQNLPTFVPVAYRWANGIDGHETARKYDVNGKLPTVFELGTDDFSSPGQVDIISVTDAVHGHAVFDSATRKVTYTPPENATEYDRFDIIVATEGGRRVTLNVNMRLVYRGLSGVVHYIGTKSDWNGQNPTVAQVKEKYNDESYDYTISTPSAGLEFTHNEMEYYHLQLKYRVPETDTYTFYVKADDAAEVNLFKSSISGDKIGTVNVKKDTKSFTTYDPVTTHLNKGETVFADCHLVNWGGLGHMTIGVKRSGSDEIIPLPADSIICAGVDDDELEVVDGFKGWQPRFVDSIKNATLDYRASNYEWQVLSAPAGKGEMNSLVDGDENTLYESEKSSVASLPHVFIIDTRAEQTFNYFEFVRRTKGDDKLLNFELYGCTESAYKTAGQGADHTGWNKLFSGPSTAINAAKQRISFARTQLRYFKFVVTQNNGLTVLKEVYAGVEAALNQTVKPSNYKTDMADFTENPANGKLTATSKGATFEFEFLGNGFELFADAAPTYGSASVVVDENPAVTVSLKEDRSLFNKQVFVSDDMDTAVHTVLITTLEDKPFNISFINVRYGTPVTVEEYPAVNDKNGNPDYGDIKTDRLFTREWKTFVKDYKTLTSIKFVKEAPADYKDTYVRIDTYIRLYRNQNKIAFVYPGKIVAPIECGSLFSGCEALTELDLANFDTTYMRGAMNMFYNCKSLASVDLSRFTTENVLSFGRMFGNCNSLANLDLSHFKLDRNANVYRMFENCTALNTITLPTDYGTAARISATEITCELPYVYRDRNTGKYITELTLNASTAGHVLELHNKHNYTTTHPIVNPECEKDGVVAYRTCSVCNCNFSTENDALYRKADLVIPALGHNYVYDWPTDASAYPTCTKPGIGGKLACDRCGDVAEEVTDVPALGHMYMIDTERGEDNKGYSVRYEKDGTATVTFYLKCDGLSNYETWEKCNHLAEITITLDYDTHHDANCVEAETYSYDAVIDKDALLAAMNAQNDDDIEDGLYAYNNIHIMCATQGEAAHGHVMEEVEAVPATCTLHGSTAGQRCSVCGYSQGVTSTLPHGHNMVATPKLDPTCTKAGHTAGQVCSFCGELGEGAKEIAALGHDFSVYVPAQAPTCTKVGHTEGKKCSHCDAVEGCEIIDDLGHEEEIMHGRPATSSQDGLTDGVRCSRCGEILQPQKKIPALGIKGGCSGFVVGGLGGTFLIVGASVAAMLALKRKRRK